MWMKMHDCPMPYTAAQSDMCFWTNSNYKFAQRNNAWVCIGLLFTICAKSWSTYRQSHSLATFLSQHRHWITLGPLEHITPERRNKSVKDESTEDSLEVKKRATPVPKNHSILQGFREYHMIRDLINIEMDTRSLVSKQCFRIPL